MEIIFSGGLVGQIIMGAIFLMLFFAIYLYLERLMAIKAASKMDQTFMTQIRMHLQQGKLENAKMLCASTNSPVARLIEKGISRIGKPLNDINIAIENAGKLEVYKLEKNVSMLATISGAGPMTGFLGTVVGMVMAFHEMAQSGSNKIEMSVLAEGIYTAMMTTVVGLIVGIIAYVGYNHLVSITDKVVHIMEVNAVDFLDLLNRTGLSMNLEAEIKSTQNSTSSITDIVFLLLIFFMIAVTTMTTTNALDLVPPDAFGQADEVETVSVSVDDKFNYYIDKQQYPEDDLENGLKTILNGQKEPNIVLNCG